MLSFTYIVPSSDGNIVHSFAHSLLIISACLDVLQCLSMVQKILCDLPTACVTFLITFPFVHSTSNPSSFCCFIHAKNIFIFWNLCLLLLLLCPKMFLLQIFVCFTHLLFSVLPQICLPAYHISNTHGLSLFELILLHSLCQCSLPDKLHKVRTLSRILPYLQHLEHASPMVTS